MSTVSTVERVKPCKKCGQLAQVPVIVQIGQRPQYTFDCLECAIETLGPRCTECGQVYLGRPVEIGGQRFCSAACAQRRQVREAWSPARGEGSIDGTGSTPPRVGVGLDDGGRKPLGTGFVAAHVGDVLVVHTRTVDRPPRRATITELRGAQGAPPYVVRWHDDDHISLCFPGTDAALERHSVAATTGG